MVANSGSTANAVLPSCLTNKYLHYEQDFELYKLSGF